MVKLTGHESLSGETVRRRLAENGLKPWRRDMWCIPQVDGEYVARMEDVLDLYAEAPDPQRPVVCFDESPVQLIGEVRQPIPAAPGQLERYDYEYRRNGTVNLFVVFDPHRAWRKVKVTERRTAKDYAHCMRELVDVHYPEAACIRVVQDNLSIHTAGALYQAFAPAEARRILRRLEFHYTPKHASWLNMVEIEIGVLRGQCLSRRIDDPKRLRSEITEWERQRNKARARIKWMFTTDKARAKIGRAYPVTSNELKNHCDEVLVGLYTGTRHAAICSAAFQPAIGRGHVDLERGVFHRRAQRRRETKKRQTPVRLSRRLIAHLRRWHRLGQATHAVVEWNGKPVKSVRKGFAAAVAEAGISKHVTPHTLRHTSATWMMQAGVDVWEAAGLSRDDSRDAGTSLRTPSSRLSDGRGGGPGGTETGQKPREQTRQNEANVTKIIGFSRAADETHRSGRGGRRFKSYHSDQYPKILNGLCAFGEPLGPN